MTTPSTQDRRRFRLRHRDADVCASGRTGGLMHLTRRADFPVGHTAQLHSPAQDGSKFSRPTPTRLGFVHAPGTQIP
jgi:hypothetical protein